MMASTSSSSTKPEMEEPGPSSSSRSRLLATIDPSLSFSRNDKNVDVDPLVGFGSRSNKSCILVQRFRGCLPDLSTRQWQLLAVFAVADFIAGIVYNIKGPFYPKEAEKKGVTATQFGFVFGIFDVTKVFICPIFGKYMSFLGPKKVFITSMVLISVCSIAFGLLDKIEDASTFLALSLMIRVCEAVGSAGFSTSTFCIIACEFPSTVATTFASLETFFGMGLIVGPLLGGALFQLGGYTLPFVVTGFLLFSAAMIIIFKMPYPTSTAPDDLSPPPPTRSRGRRGGRDSKPEEDTDGFSLLDVLKIPGVILAAFGVFAAASSAGFVNATLEPHIRQFNLSPVQVGVVFVIYGTVYAITAPAWGWLCDRVTQPKVITLAGGVLNLFAFLLIGPAPFLAFDSVLWVTCLGLVLHGLALGATFVSGFVLSLRYSIASGFPNNMATYAVVSGMWTAALSLGMFCGPVIGGVLLENVGFRWGSVYVLASMLILIILIVLYLMKNGIHIRGCPTDSFCEDVIPPEAAASSVTQPLLKSRTIRLYSSDDFSGGSSGQAQLISYGSA